MAMSHNTGTAHWFSPTTRLSWVTWCLSAHLSVWFSPSTVSNTVSSSNRQLFSVKKGSWKCFKCTHTMDFRPWAIERFNWTHWETLRWFILAPQVKQKADRYWRVENTDVLFLPRRCYDSVLIFNVIERKPQPSKLTQMALNLEIPAWLSAGLGHSNLTIMVLIVFQTEKHLAPNYKSTANK